MVEDRFKYRKVAETIPTHQDEQCFPQSLIIVFHFYGETLQTLSALITNADGLPFRWTESLAVFVRP